LHAHQPRGQRRHIYQTNLYAGRYDLQVWKGGGTTVTTNEAYALAFEFFPQPILNARKRIEYTVTWPFYPAGFLVEAATNLISSSWNTNNLPAASSRTARTASCSMRRMRTNSSGLRPPESMSAFK